MNSHDVQETTRIHQKNQDHKTSHLHRMNDPQHENEQKKAGNFPSNDVKRKSDELKNSTIGGF